MDKSMKREVMRRSSIEVEQLANWKQQQTLQEIEALKSGRAVTTKPISSSDQHTDHDNKSRLNKLVARKQKAEARQNSSFTSLNFDQLQIDSSSDLHSKANRSVNFSLPSTSDSPTNYSFSSSSLNPSNSTVNIHTGNNNEVDILLQEKKYFLARLNEDNDKMVKLLEDLREAKFKLQAAIEVVENERDRLKGYQVDISSACIDDYLMESSGGATNGLMAFQETDDFLAMNEEQQFERSTAADELQRTLLAVVARLKANQQEHNEFVFAKIQDICAHFIQDPRASVSTLNDEIAHLRDVVEVCSAKSLYTAEDVTQALVSSLVESVVNHKAVVVATNNVLVKDPSKSAAKQAEGRGRHNSLDSATVTQAELDALVAQNETLKTSLAQMRKSNAQLRTNVAAGVIQSSGSSSPNKRGGNSGTKRGSHISSYNNTSQNAHTGSGEEEDNGESSEQDEEAAENNLDLEFELPVPAVETPKLPQVVSDYLLSQLSDHVQQLMEGHPLAATGIPMDIFEAAIKEVAQQALPIASYTLAAHLRHKGVDIAVVEGIASCTDVSLLDGKVTAALKKSVEHTLHVNSVHAEISSLVTLYLVFLNSRLGLSVEPAASPVHSQATPLNENQYSSGGGSSHQSSASQKPAWLRPMQPSAQTKPRQQPQHQHSQQSTNQFAAEASAPLTPIAQPSPAYLNDFDHHSQSGASYTASYANDSVTGTTMSGSNSPYMLGQSSNGAREYTRGQSSNSSTQSVPRYMMPKGKSVSNISTTSATTPVR